MRTAYQIITQDKPHLTGMKKVRAVRHLANQRPGKKQHGHVVGKTKRGAMHKTGNSTMSTANLVNGYA